MESKGVQTNQMVHCLLEENLMTRRISIRKGEKGGWWVIQPGKRNSWHQSKVDANRQKEAAVRVKRRRGQRKRRAGKRGTR